MNQKQIKSIAEELERLLLETKKENDRYHSIYGVIKPILLKAKRGEIIYPLEKPLNMYFFFEGLGRSYNDKIDHKVRSYYMVFSEIITSSDIEYEKFKEIMEKHGL